MPGPTPSQTDLALAADQAAARDTATTDAPASAARTPDARGADAGGADASSRASTSSRDEVRDDAARRDPSTDVVPGDDDAGAQGHDRAHGGWGDRGLFGGRAGGTGG